MNIFILDYDIKKCAQYHCDKHVVKMILEYAQLLSTACRVSGIEEGYKATHINHPCAKWVRESLDNWIWLQWLLEELHIEWKFRYNHPESKEHKSYTIAKNLGMPDIPKIGRTEFALAMPDEYKTGDAVESYRTYYRNDKRHLATWKNRDKPEWWY